MKRTHVPGDVVAPADGLDPVDRPCVEPDQVARPLDEAVNGDVGLVQVFQVGPPRAHQEINVVSGEEQRTVF